MRYRACFVAILMTFVVACSGGDIDPAVDLYEFPGGEEGRVVIDPDDFVFEFRFDHEPRGADTECRFEEEDWFDCESPYFFDQDSEEFDLEEGYLRFAVRSYTEEDISPAAQLELLVLYDFDFGLGDAEVYEEGSPDTAFYFPDEYSAFCSRIDCEILCHWEADAMNENVAADCSLEEPFELEFPADHLENAYLQVEACATNFGGDQDDEHCLGPKTYLFYPPPPAFDDLDAGDRHTCGLVEDGSIWCWGRNNAGQVGIGDAIDEVPLATKVLYRNWESLSAGSQHTCAINTEGELFCWGDNSSGQLGFDPVDHRQPEEVTDLSHNGPWVTVSAGGLHTCAINDDGGLFCWGDNSRDQLGNMTDGGIPLQDPGTAGWIDVSAGDFHTCAIAHKSGGGTSAFCWGDRTAGRLGDGASSGTTDIPQEVSGDLRDWHTQEISAGIEHTCAIATSGTNRRSYCWGEGSSGRLGTANFTSWSTPQRLVRGDDQFEDYGPNDYDDHLGIAAGDEHSCAVHERGEVFCWGENIRNQIGTGGDLSNEPVRTLTPEGVLFDVVTTGEEHSCAIDRSGKAYCWGRDDHGRLGLEADGDGEVPTLIAWPQGEFIPTPHSD